MRCWTFSPHCITPNLIQQTFITLLMKYFSPVLLGHALVHYCTNFSNSSGKLRCFITITLKAENMFVGHVGYFSASANICKAFAILIIEVILLTELPQPNLEDGKNEKKNDWVIFHLNDSFCIKQIHVNTCIWIYYWVNVQNICSNKLCHFFKSSNVMIPRGEYKSSHLVSLYPKAVNQYIWHLADRVY